MIYHWSFKDEKGEYCERQTVYLKYYIDKNAHKYKEPNGWNSMILIMNKIKGLEAYYLDGKNISWKMLNDF